MPQHLPRSLSTFLQDAAAVAARLVLALIASLPVPLLFPIPCKLCRQPAGWKVLSPDGLALLVSRG